MDIVTADGGFDFSTDFNNQEKQACNLIFAEICFAILTQKQGGTFIIKFFDIFNMASIDLIYILSCFYGVVSITKPCTSRSANSEKYIVCENFKYSDTSEYFKVIYSIFNRYDLKKTDIKRFISIPIPVHFLNKIKEINYLLGQHQIENINNTIELIISDSDSKRLDNYVKKNTTKCIEWCSKNNVPCNNVFLV